MNNKLAEALGIKFCKTCGEEIVNVIGEPTTDPWISVCHDTKDKGNFWFSQIWKEFTKEEHIDRYHIAMTREEYEQ